MMEMPNEHQKSVDLEQLCRGVFTKQKENQVGYSTLGGTFNADTIDRGGLSQILSVTFAPYYFELQKEQWSQIEELLNKYRDTYELSKDDKKEYFKLVDQAYEDVRAIDKELKLRK